MPTRPDFAPSAIAAAVREMQAVTRRAAARRHGGPSRRRFLQAGALAVGLPLLGSGCGGRDNDPPQPQQPLTLFFNYSHLAHAGKSMSIQVGRNSYRLRPIGEAPHLLERERKTNRFLAGVEDRHITHVAEGVPAPAPDVVGFCYGVTDGANGTWTMDSIGILLPEAAASVAYERMRARNGGNATLALSPKRRKYGLPPAASARDLHEEQALQDTLSHAATLVTMHKDMLALDGAAAHTVVNAHVMQSLGVDDIDDQIQQLGTAAPEAGKGVVSPTGWATLRPLPDASGNPRRIAAPGDPADGRVVYMPVLHPSVSALVGSTVASVLPDVQNDETLGADVTGRPPGSSLRGALWARRDGRPTVKQATAAAAPASSAVSMEPKWPAGQNHWLECDATVTSLGGGNQQLEVSYSNTGLRYLGCFIEFYDESGQLIKLGTMPGFSDGTWVTSPSSFSYDPDGDLGDQTRAFIGSIASLGTLMGIPVFTDSTFYGSLDITLKMSSRVNKVRLYAGGLGSGSNNYPETIAGGVAGTMLVNYVITTLFGALGAIPDLDIALSLMSVGGSALLAAIAAGTLDSVDGNHLFTQQFWIDQGLNLLNLLIGLVAGSADPLLRALGEGLAGLLGEAAAQSAIEKAIPVVGVILNIESALAAIADFVLTTVAIAQSPYTYLTDLVFTHDLAVTVNHDPGNSTFPKAANVLTAIATFDDGTPHRMDIDLPPSGGYPTSLPAVRFTGVPFGGQVEIRVEFHQRALDGSVADNILLGGGTTGKVNNDDVTPYVITIAEKAYPVGPDTRYRHNQRTYLDGGGRHVWVTEAAPTTPPAKFACGSAGQVCQFNGITVRQGTDKTATMLGYAWRGQNLSGGGDVGQQALLNADVPSAGYALAADPRAVAGLDIALSRNAGGGDSFYVDPTGAFPMIRGVTLDGAGAPRFDAPSSNRAYGMLNLPSQALLLHPSGALVSIGGSDRFEVLRPPAAAVTDAVAQQQYIAQVIGGSGDRPGKTRQVVAATITKDGTLLMLENGNNRIQAFDIGSNPVRYFSNAPQPYFLPLAEMPTSGGWRHLDIQADFTGLLYVLSFNTQSGVYRLSIYDNLAKLQQALSVTEGVYAARIGLDHWRDLYTLNYEPIKAQGSGAPPAVTEPSVSLWTPCTQGLTC